MDKIAELRALPDVALAEPNYRVTIFKSATDPRYPYQWHLPKIAAPVSWDTTTGSKKVKVCIIDSGARIDHPDLAGNILKGWNVVNGTAAPNPEFYNFNDTLGHGTHVAGLIAALGNNARGVSGVAWQTSLLICKFINDMGWGDIYDAITCMRLCKEEEAVIYNNSWGGLSFAPWSLLEEIEALQETNGLFVVAAGNAASNLDVVPRYPASYDAINQLTVAATTPSDLMAGFSDYGPETVHIAAPGQGLLSTTRDGDYEMMSGTSMACPVVAGAAALLQSMALNKNNTPLTPQKVRGLLMDNSDAVAWGSGAVKSGRLNVAKAVAALKIELGGYSDPVPDITSPSVPSMPQAERPPAPLQNGDGQGGSDGAANPIAAIPECGTSVLRGQAANQSSVAGNYNATNAVNGDCRNNMAEYGSACAATDPGMSNPWWTAALSEPGEVVAISITTRADCCWNAIGSAVLFVGNTTWTGYPSVESFTECSQIPLAGIPRGQRMTFQCSNAIQGTTIAIFLPKIKTSLILCEVDVALRVVGNSSSSSTTVTAVAVAAPSPFRRRKRALLHTHMPAAI